MQPKLKNRSQRMLLGGVLCAGLLMWPGLTLATTSAASPSHDSLAAQVNVGKRAVVRGGGAVLREQPNGQGLLKLPLAAAVMATARTDDSKWILVELEDGTVGWVHVDEIVIFGVDWLPVSDAEIVVGTPDDNGLVEALSPEEVSTTVETSSPSDTYENDDRSSPDDEFAVIGRVDTNEKRLNVRAGPGTSYPIITSLNAGTPVTVGARNENSDWVQIKLAESDDIGWVSVRYVDLDRDPGDLPVSKRLSQAQPIRSPSASASATGLNGKLVIQQRSGGPIYKIDLGSGNIAQLTTGLDPALSPDGQTVAFIRDDATPGIYLIDIDGSNERRIYAQEKLRAPSWSPDGQYIAFSRVTGQYTCRSVGWGICLPDHPSLVIFPLVTRDERGLSRVTAQGDSFLDIGSTIGASAPDWDENGIVYQSAAGLQISSVDSHEIPRVVSGEYRFQDPNWHPLINRIVFHSLEKDHREIFIINDDGSGLIALTRPLSRIGPAVQNVAPVWSPDGKSILFLSNRSGDWAVWVMNADGSNHRRVPIDLSIEYNYNTEQVFSWGE